MAFLAVIMLFVAGVAWHYSKQSEEKELIADYHLAKVFEEKTLSALKTGRDDQDIKPLRKVWLCGLKAQTLGMPAGKKALLGATMVEPSDMNLSALSRQRIQTPALADTLSVESLVHSPDGTTLASGSRDNTARLWQFNSSSCRLIYEFDSELVLEALKFLWEMELDDLHFVHQPREPRLLPLEGYYFTYDTKFRPLLDLPLPGETKMAQLVRWLEEQ